MANKRPQYLNLFRIKLPLPGVVSILHRVSGALLFLAIPLLLLGLQASLASPESFEAVRRAFSHPLVKLILLGLLWSLFHHFFAGLRYIAMDMDLGLDLPQTRRNSWLVMTATICLTLLTGVWLW